jgi:hypothetical protein
LALWFGPWAWPVALLPFFLVGDFLTVPVVLSHTLSLTWIFLSVALDTVILDRVKSARTLILPAYVFAAGAITNFLSFLFNPPLAPALIAFLVIAHDIRHRTYRTPQSLLYAGGLAALWFAGYFAIWIEKWAFAALVLGPDAVAGELMANVGKYEGISRAEGLGLLGATWDNLAPNGLFLGYIVCSIAVAVTLIAWLMKTRRCTAEHFVEFLAMLTPLLVIVVWVELNPGHSAWHTGFVSRSFLLFSIIPLLAALLIWRRTSPLPALGRASAEPAPG